MSKVYMVEVGVLLPYLDKQYEVKINGETQFLYDENIVAFFDKEKALEFLNDYVNKGVKETYGVLWGVNRKLDEYEIKEIKGNGYLENEFLPRVINNVYFKIKESEWYEQRKVIFWFSELFYW